MRQSLPGLLLWLWESCCNVINGLGCLNVSSVAEFGLLAVPFSAHLCVTILCSSGCSSADNFFNSSLHCFCSGCAPVLSFVPSAWAGVGQSSCWGVTCSGFVSASLHHSAQAPGLTSPSRVAGPQCLERLCRAQLQRGRGGCFLFSQGATISKKTVQTLSCHGSHDSFLVSFCFWHPKVLAVLGWVLHPDLSALFYKSNDIQEQSRMFQGLPFTE